MNVIGGTVSVFQTNPSKGVADLARLAKIIGLVKQTSQTQRQLVTKLSSNLQAPPCKQSESSPIDVNMFIEGAS